MLDGCAAAAEMSEDIIRPPQTANNKPQLAPHSKCPLTVSLRYQGSALALGVCAQGWHSMFGTLVGVGRGWLGVLRGGATLLFWIRFVFQAAIC